MIKRQTRLFWEDLNLSKTLQSTQLLPWLNTVGPCPIPSPAAWALPSSLIPPTQDRGHLEPSPSPRPGCRALPTSHSNTNPSSAQPSSELHLVFWHSGKQNSWGGKSRCAKARLNSNSLFSSPANTLGSGFSKVQDALSSMSSPSPLLSASSHSSVSHFSLPIQWALSLCSFSVISQKVTLHETPGNKWSQIRYFALILWLSFKTDITFP